MLRPLAAVEEERAAVEDDGDTRHVALACRRASTRAEEEDADVVHWRLVSHEVFLNNLMSRETRNQKAEGLEFAAGGRTNLTRGRERKAQADVSFSLCPSLGDLRGDAETQRGQRGPTSLEDAKARR